MATNADAPGLRRTVAVWAIWAAVGAATFATNARVPVSQLYAVDAGGVVGAAGRVVVLLGWPVALAAVATMCFAADRLLSHGAQKVVVLGTAALALALCLTILAPGVVDPKDVDIRTANVPAAVGTALAVALTVWALVDTGAGATPPVRHARSVALVVAILGLAALPWLLANLGLYVGDVPGLDHVYMSKELRPERGYPHLRAVHLGNHDGLDGLLLALTAAMLMADARRLRRFREPALAYLSLLVVYGVGVAAADWSVEQVAKRHWTAHGLASVSRPSLSIAWAVVLALSAAVWWAVRRPAATRPAAGS